MRVALLRARDAPLVLSSLLPHEHKQGVANAVRRRRRPPLPLPVQAHAPRGPAAVACTHAARGRAGVWQAIERHAALPEHELVRSGDEVPCSPAAPPP